MYVCMYVCACVTACDEGGDEGGGAVQRFHGPMLRHIQHPQREQRPTGRNPNPNLSSNSYHPNLFFSSSIYLLYNLEKAPK